MLFLLDRLEPGTTQTITALAAELGESPADVAGDLVALSMCGLPPYSPDALVSIYVDGDEVVVWGNIPRLQGRVRFTPPESRALLAALEAAGFGAETGLAQTLMEALGPAEEEATELVTRVRAGSHGGTLARLAAAIEQCFDVEIVHFAAHRDQTRCRIVAPLSLTNRAGAWYLFGWCRSAGDYRHFRVDRISEVRPTDDRFDPAQYSSQDAAVAQFDTARDHVATVKFAPDSGVDPHDWPGSEFEFRSDGTAVARVPYGDEGWVTRQVVSMLGRAEVEYPPRLQESVKQTAKLLLQAYE